MKILGFIVFLMLSVFIADSLTELITLKNDPSSNVISTVIWIILLGIGFLFWIMSGSEKKKKGDV